MNNTEEECGKGEKVYEVNIIHLKINKNVWCYSYTEPRAINSGVMTATCSRLE